MSSLLERTEERVVCHLTILKLEAEMNRFSSIDVAIVVKFLEVTLPCKFILDPTREKDLINATFVEAGLLLKETLKFISKDIPRNSRI